MRSINKIFVTIAIVLCVTSLSFADICFNIEFPGKAVTENTTKEGGDLKATTAYYERPGLSLVADKITVVDKVFKKRTNKELVIGLIEVFAKDLKVKDVKVTHSGEGYAVIMTRNPLVCFMYIVVRPPNIVMLVAIDWNSTHEKEVKAFFKSFKEIPCGSKGQTYE